MKLAIVCCLHGTEPYGLEVVNRLPVFFPFFIGNEKALKENKRFIDTDLNRSFPGKENGNHEEKIAYELVSKLNSFDYIIDLHSSSNNSPIFGIITKPNCQKIDFAKQLGLSKLVIMKDSFASGKALIDFVKCGISIEVGPHKRERNVNEALELIYNFINKKTRNEDLEIFEVFDIIKKEADSIKIRNFEFVKKGEIIAKSEDKEQIALFDFIPILVGEDSYNEILCLAAKKL
jgi:succinylglutamate desuccinylase